MRTTVLLPDALYKRVRLAAAREGRTFTSFLEQALREALERHGASGASEAYRVDAFRGTGLRAGVDLDSSAALLDVMESDARG